MPPIETQIILRLDAEDERDLFAELDARGLERSGDGVLALVWELLEDDTEPLTGKIKRHIENNPQHVEAAMKIGAKLFQALRSRKH